MNPMSTNRCLKDKDVDLIFVSHITKEHLLIQLNKAFLSMAKKRKSHQILHDKQRVAAAQHRNEFFGKLN